MADTAVRVRLNSLNAVDLELFLYPADGGAALNPGGDALAAVDADGLLYEATVAEAVAGNVQWAVVKNGQTVPLYGPGTVKVEDDSGPYYIGEQPVEVVENNPYWAIFDLEQDETTGTDVYSATIIKDDEALETATNVQIRVIKPDGLDLIAKTPMTQVVGARWRYTEAVNNILPGTGYFVDISFDDENGQPQLFSEQVGRDRQL